MCRHCHDEAEDHRLEASSVTHMVCMDCGEQQAPAAECRACHTRMAAYYCGICQLFDDQPGRDIYHCPFCNICRLGKGLGRDVRHCMQCNCCMDLAEFKQHKCRDLSTCPVCTEYLFDSNSPYRVGTTPTGRRHCWCCACDLVCCADTGFRLSEFQLSSNLCPIRVPQWWVACQTV